MKLSRHPDGSYSITDITRHDLGELTYGMVSAAASPRHYHGIDAEGIARGKLAQAGAERLYSALAALERTAGAGSITVVSAQGYGDENAFYVKKINKIRGWRDENGVAEDITSHLKRKGA